MLRGGREQLPRRRVAPLPQRIGIVTEREQIIVYEMLFELRLGFVKRRDIGIQVGHNVKPNAEKREHPDKANESWPGRRCPDDRRPSIKKPVTAARS
jgi:hypothetical protein